MNWVDLIAGIGIGFAGTVAMCSAAAIHVARNPELIVKAMFAKNKRAAKKKSAEVHEIKVGGNGV